MAGPLYESVEYLEVDTDATTDNVLTDLTKGQDYTQCIPIYSNRALGALTDQHQERCVRVTFEDNGGTPAVRVQKTAAADSDDTRAHIFVWELPSAINVQQVDVSSFTGTSVSPTFTSVGAQNQAFMLYSYDYTSPPSSDDDFDDICVQVRFNSTDTDTALLTRRASGGTVNGTLYVVDCDSGEFTVDHREIDITTSSDTSGTDTISSTTTAATFLMHSYESSEAEDDMRDAGWYADLQDSTTVRVRRTISGTPSATSTHSIAVVEAQDSEFDVQRNAALTITGNSTTDSITAIDQARSIILHNSGWDHHIGRNDAVLGANVDSAMGGWDFSADDTVRVQFTNYLTNQIHTYEVVQFAETAGAATYPGWYQSRGGWW